MAEKALQAVLGRMKVYNRRVVRWEHNDRDASTKRKSVTLPKLDLDGVLRNWVISEFVMPPRSSLLRSIKLCLPWGESRIRKKSYGSRMDT